MSNGIITAADSNEARVQSWCHIDDFSPGIWDGSFISSAEPVVSAPIGAANADGTFACASITGGALAPLPGIVERATYPEGFPGTATTIYVTGFAANLALDDGTTELVIILEADDGTDHYFSGWSSIDGGAVNGIFNEVDPSYFGVFGSRYPSWTRASLQPVEGQSGYVLPTITLVFPAAILTDGSTTFGHLYFYPDPNNPTAFGVLDAVSPGDTSGTGEVFCYGDRVLVFQGQGSDWPVGSGVNINENIGFTDPPLSYLYPLNFGADIPNSTILSAETPWGYGAWGSVSVGEAIFIKHEGGAVVVNGDIEAPSSVIPLPAVQSVGNTDGLAVSANIGLVYCSQNQGAWVWNGGNTSQKLSPQLSDDFFDVGQNSGTIPVNGYGFLCERWQDWILFSNNYLYNPDTGGWWILYPNQSQTSDELVPQTFFWFKQGRAGYEMYAAPLTLTVPLHDWYSKFDNRTPSAHWQWQSLPIHVVPTADRAVDVRQVILRLSSPDSTSPTATVSIGGATDTTSGTIGPNPTTFRFNLGVGALGLDDIIITVNGDNASGSAPILHSIDIGYNIVASIGTDN